MFNKDTPIQQLIYTAGGSKKNNPSNSNFGTYSVSKEIANQKKEIEEKISVILYAKPEAFKTQYAIRQVLKEGAKPHGLFIKKYYDSDYETVKTLTSHPIHILEGVKEGDLRLSQQERSRDYRGHPELAPYRIAATKLLDGKLMIVKVTAVNRVYSTLDQRTGNYFAHAFIFPKGVELSDININELVFRNGLEKHEWGENGISAPDYLPATSINEMHSQKQKETETENLSLEDLLNIYKKTLINNRDYKSRMENQKIFNKEIVKGTNLFQLKSIIKNMFVNSLKSGKNINDLDENILTDLEIIETPHTKLLSDLEKSIELQQKLDEAYANDASETEINKLEKDIDVLNSSIDEQLKNFSQEELKQVVECQKNYLKLSAEFDSLAKGIKQNDGYRLKNDYKAVLKLETNINKLKNTQIRK